MNRIDCDVLIVGAGPAGLLTAAAVARLGLSARVIDPKPLAELAAPAEDGREIALHRHSQRILAELGAWDEIGAADRFAMRGARVMDRDLAPSLAINPRAGEDSLGVLVPNRALRGAAWRAASALPGVAVGPGRRLVALAADPAGIEAMLEAADGTRGPVRAKLLVAADSRFSQTRRMLGIPAEQYDVGKSMLVCRMRHAEDHRSIALEWFGLAQTLALLPLAPGLCSVVLTLPPAEMRQVTELAPEAFARDIERRFQGRLGAMELVGERHVYPLVATYARHFAAPRAVLVGDAAVGMHPVTAHGMNFGLTAIELLSQALAAAVAQGRDIGDPAVLGPYARRLRLATRPLYLATLGIVRLYTDPRPPALALRGLALRVGAALPRLPGRPGASHLAALLSRPPLPRQSRAAAAI
jgi:ubiquinone biosynthesis UbiH/UbiF/VisC/COQ6 family hydroxylase